MKKEIHPENYRYVVFQDISCDYSFLTKQQLNATKRIFLSLNYEITSLNFEKVSVKLKSK